MKTEQIHCAIYTRKSTEEGLEQDFNSLDTNIKTHWGEAPSYRQLLSKVPKQDVQQNRLKYLIANEVLHLFPHSYLL